MSRPYRRRPRGGTAPRLIACVVALLAGTVVGIPASASTGTPAGRPDGGPAAVDPRLIAQLPPGRTGSFLVYLRAQATLDTAARLADRRARAAAVHRELTTTATRSQAGLRAMLDERGAAYTAYWISNTLRVTGDRALLDLVAARPDVARVEPARELPLIAPVARRPAAARTAATGWGLSSIQAPRVWTEFGVRGEGVVVANIDSGVDHTHPALAAQYRGRRADGGVEHDYNWYDPTGVCPGDAPCDNNAHGTHTMGTMVGDGGAGNEIGVAPGARWIAVKGCESTGCSDGALLAAGQWILAPTDRAGRNPRPDLRPDIVNNSWGGGPGEPWYRDTVRAWAAAGIFPAFATGNAGPGCASAGSPGDYPDSYAVGAYGSDGKVADFSSRGASRLDGGVKPDLAGPGVQIRSSVPGGGYAAYDGTSMATPHLSGAVALLWSAAPGLRGDLPATRGLLDDNAGDADDTSCGGTADDNNAFGEGRLDAYTTVRNAPRGPNGRVAGTVTDASTGRPLPGVVVGADGRDATTGPDGRYTLTLPVGDHTVTATRYGHRTGRASVQVPEGGAVAADLALTPADLVTVQGTVTDGSGHGWPLYARLTVAGRPGGPVFTDPATGRYTVRVPAETGYAVTVDAVRPGYRQLRQRVDVGAGDLVADLRLPVEPACTADGYTAGYGSPLLAESVPGGAVPAGWKVVNRVDGGGGWVFDDPGGRGNLTGGTGGFAVVDSDWIGGSTRQDTDLVTPPLDLSGTPAPYLRFHSDWRATSSGDSANVDVSTDGGSTWTTVWNQTQSRRGPTLEEIPLQPAAGAGAALVRFRYVGAFGWWWQVDDVEVRNRTCTPAAGGVVTGFTTDANTGAGLNGVTVGHAGTESTSERVTSAATPDDPNLPDGFYWLFAGRSGEQPLTAQRRPYQPHRRTVAVAPDGVTRADFTLTAGRLAVGPASIDFHQPYGSTRRASVTVTNTGSAPATVSTVEQPGSFELLGRAGAALVRQPVKGLSPAHTGPTYPGRAPATATAAAGDTAWTAVPEHPAPVYDNAAAVLDGKVYSVGGGNATATGTERTAWVYDPMTGAWSGLPDLPTGRAKASAVALAGRLYVLGGWGPGGVPVSTVDVFDPATGAWSTVPGAVNPRPTAAAGTAVVDGRAYLVGGCTDGPCGQSAETMVFDPATGGFSTAPAYPHPVSWVSCGGIGGAVYCAGGLGATAYRDGFVLDRAAGGWKPLPAMPVDLWGAQYAAAGGLLVVAGGATGNSTAVTNQTVGYDPAAGAWRALPNARHARFRGAGACGAYKIGGSPAPFVAGAESELLGGLEMCGPGGDAPWLSTTPAELVLPPGTSRTVTVELTATEAAGVAQPGRYAAKLALRSDTPYPVGGVPVTMQVAPPASWGRIGGTVVGVTCAGERVPLPATVRINPADPTRGRTLAADPRGGYAHWVPRGKYDVIVARDGWVPQVHRVTVTAGLLATVDADLVPASACPFTGRW